MRNPSERAGGQKKCFRFGCKRLENGLKRKGGGVRPCIWKDPQFPGIRGWVKKESSSSHQYKVLERRKERKGL